MGKATGYHLSGMKPIASPPAGEAGGTFGPPGERDFGGIRSLDSCLRCNDTLAPSIRLECYAKGNLSKSNSEHGLSPRTPEGFQICNPKPNLLKIPGGQHSTTFANFFKPLQFLRLQPNRFGSTMFRTARLSEQAGLGHFEKYPMKKLTS